MTITIKSNPDGVSGAIQVNGVDRLTVNSSGAVTASTNPATGLRSTALATMQKFADEFGSSLASSGYQKLPSGLIIQWGGGTPNGAGNYQAALPIAFPTFQIRALATAQGDANPALCISVFSLTTTGIDVRVRTLGGAASTIPVSWIAIGC